MLGKRWMRRKYVNLTLNLVVKLQNLVVILKKFNAHI